MQSLLQVLSIAFAAKRWRKDSGAGGYGPVAGPEQATERVTIGQSRTFRTMHATAPNW